MIKYGFCTCLKLELLFFLLLEKVAHDVPVLMLMKKENPKKAVAAAPVESIENSIQPSDTRVRTSSGKVSSPFILSSSSSSGNALRLNVKVTSAKGLKSVKAMWGTKIERYCVCTFNGEEVRTEPELRREK